MLIIRDEQMRVLAQALTAAFKSKLASDLKQRFAEIGRIIDQDRLSLEVEGAIAAATAVGLERECDIARYAFLVIKEFGGQWTEPLPPQARRILGATAIPPEQRLSLLEEWTEDWKGFGS